MSVYRTFPVETSIHHVSTEKTHLCGESESYPNAFVIITIDLEMMDSFSKPELKILKNCKFGV